jgi:pantothenate synthetase
MNKRKKFVPAKQYLHRTGTLFIRLLRDAQGKAIVIIYLNNLQIAGDAQLLECARTIFNDVEHFITEECKKAGC